MKSGHFVVKKGKHFEFQQYRVDFIPNIDIAIVRKALIREHEKVLGGYLYDGDATIYLTKSLQKESMDFAGKLKDGSLVKITIKNTPSFITATDSRVMQLLNLILRRAMGGLNLQLVGRNLFDAAAAIKIKEFNMELWPGYVTSIRQHESEILVGGEIDFKVMRNETAYNILRQCFANSRFAKDAFMKEMIGMTVLTDYNNKTYRIDDVDWNSSPTSTFNTKNGSISYKDYYQRRYDIKIIDDKQPILVSKSKAKDLRAGQSELIALIPELCRVTGITDEMRKNFGIMKDLAQRTKLSPADRIIHLLDLNQRLQSNPRSKAVFEKYDVSLSDSLVEFQGRTLLPEKIKFGDKEVVMDQRSEWTHAFRKCELFTKKKLSNWFVVTPKKFDDKAKIFVNKMLEASRGMGFDMQPPLW